MRGQNTRSAVLCLPLIPFQLIPILSEPLPSILIPLSFTLLPLHPALPTHGSFCLHLAPSCLTFAPLLLLLPLKLLLLHLVFYLMLIYLLILEPSLLNHNRLILPLDLRHF